MFVTKNFVNLTGESLEFSELRMQNFQDIIFI